MYPQVNPKQSFPDLEEKILAFWKENKTFEKSIESRPESEPYRFYDGPPFITGTPHYGSLLSSVGKDVVTRYRTMQGKRIDRVWGWDCHGIPIEDKVQKKLGISSNKEVEEIGLEKFTEECYNYTRSVSAEWEWYIDHIGRWVDFKNSYKTMDQSYMESVMWVFKSLHEKGLVYKGKRVSLYSTKLSTPISNFEVAMDDSYEEVNDPAITVAFDISANGEKFKNTNILAWTTTPWTISANIALAVNETLEYSKVSFKDVFYIVASSRIETVFKGKEYEVVGTISGKELVGLSYNPPFDFYSSKLDLSKNFRVYHADFITDEDGTGIAHQAPEFGDADFQLGKKYGLFNTEAIDNEGKYTSEISDYKGVYFRDANAVISDKLKELGKLFNKESITHRVAMCPRTNVPLIYKTQDSWFLDIQKLKPKLIEKNEDIYWFPTHLKHGRFLKSMEAAPDWCLSRTRYWSTPMPVWFGYDENGEQKDMKIFGSIKEIEDASGMKVKDLHRPYIDEITWKENGLTYTRVKEVLDVWLDSSSMPYAQVHYPFENKEKFEAGYPADYIAEYIGQVRAWFYVMHVIGVALFDKPSYKNVITTGVLAGTDGRKMSKSYGNYPDPKETMLKHGGDSIRYYLMNSPLMSGGDIAFNEDGIIESIKKVMLPFWNTYSFFTTYANIDNFKPKKGNIYFARHGETANNKNGVVSGGNDDTSLNDKGIQDSIELGKKLSQRGIKLDCIITSAMKRAGETAEYVRKELGYDVEIIVDDRFREQSYGEFIGMSHEDICKKHKVDYSGRAYRNNLEEPLNEFIARVESGYEELTKKYEGKNILMISHGGVYRVINKILNDLTIEDAFYKNSMIGNTTVIKLPNYKKENNLDKWIYSELQKLITDVSRGFDNYDLQSVTRPITDFMDNLTNWYIRRSRRRFWKSENDGDKLQAYNTLYEVLVELSKIIAPIVPFISEEVFKGLTNCESVHLEYFPESNKTWIFDSLIESMNKTQKIINLGLSLRGNKKIRVRQPLQSVTIGEKLEEYYIEIIKEELNVKEVIILDDMSKIAHKICKPNARLIGPRFGSKVQDIIKEAKAGNFIELENGGIKIPHPNPLPEVEGVLSGYILDSGEYEIAYEMLDGVTADIQAGFGMVMAMDTVVSESLKLEGYARDIVRAIQDARKEAGYNVSDRINIAFSGELSIDILSNFKSYIEGETLSSVVDKLPNSDISKEVDLEESKVSFELKR